MYDSILVTGALVKTNLTSEQKIAIMQVVNAALFAHNDARYFEEGFNEGFMIPVKSFNELSTAINQLAEIFGEE